jgi:phosphoribosylpyrophosphate synthetase
MPVFLEAARNNPQKIVTLGTYFNSKETLNTRGALQYVKETGAALYSVQEKQQDEATLRWTRQINALNKERIWARERFFTQLSALVCNDICLCIVPSHDPFKDDTPLRQLAQMLAREPEKNRTDATGCIVRHTKIQKITYGGPSYKSLHKQSIELVHPELVRGRDVLLLDDIAKSGASLRACQELLLEAGASTVQMLALGRLHG